MKQLLVTGANGFLGKYFCSKYQKSYGIKTFSFLNDNLDELHCEGIYTIVHLSALVHQMGGATYEEYKRVNVTQTLQLALKAKDAGVKQFIFMSSVKVYGEETEIAYNEQSKCNPLDSYGKTKLEAEKQLLQLEDEDFKITIIRIPIVYGYGVKANIQNLIKLTKKVSLLPFKNIQNKRSIVYVGNLCHLLYIVIEKEQKGVFLASDDAPLSTSRLIELIATSLDRKVFLIKVPLFQTFLRLLKPEYYKRLYCSLEVNNEQTKQQLSLENPYSTFDGIRFMIFGERF